MITTDLILGVVGLILSLVMAIAGFLILKDERKNDCGNIDNC